MPNENNIIIPKHVAIIMDGNGRWAQSLGKNRLFGHKKGADVVFNTVEHIASLGSEVLTLFAFSSENWKRPEDEVKGLMELFAFSIKHQTKRLHENNIKVRFIGDRSKFSTSLNKAIDKAQNLTLNNQKFILNVAVNYGGRWDIVNACRQIVNDSLTKHIDIQAIDEAFFNQYLSCTNDVDLLIRTGGEFRVSNFLLWNLAYSEIFISNKLWPDFTNQDIDEAFAFFSKRERRFGMISEQVSGN